ncbi:MAG: cobalt-precorrin-6A reductase [Timaviella obliquedivisa GSE-PSE-MK23-08B]|jgi:precorrin-6A/cobalt-precorrin-6A reductase|nr:cobalt-precorrin-6A reductase [Timaviella obliquedivisa GSE-PSE-MK23-08B]
MKRLLILGGTGDAVALAKQAAQIPYLETITSLAGRTQTASAPGNTRIGGFGGAAGLADYLRDRQIHLLVDATHPFAAQITWNASIAAKEVGIPHLMLIRSAWEKTAGDRWIEVESNAIAATVLPAQRIFLTIGRQELSAFAQRLDCWFLMRMIDPPTSDARVPNGKILLERGPFAVADERALLQNYNIGAIVSKNSGGEATYAKIIAAREMEIPVVMVQRPIMPIGEVATRVEEALNWILKDQ